MWYFLLYLAIGIWIYIDSQKRLYSQGIKWAVATVLLGPLVAPVYIAKRPLKKDEMREGGTGWNILKNFALFWTITIAIATVAGLINAGNMAGQVTNEYEMAGAGIGVALGMGMLFFVWFVPMISAVALGFFLKKSTVVERGPTGLLADR
jgi:hypothetical protein